MRGLVTLLLIVVLSGCQAVPKVGSAERVTITDVERESYKAELVQEDKPYSFNREGTGVLYDEDGVVITAEGILEVETWKLNKLAESYELQNPLDYVLEVEELPIQSTDWMTSKVITKDFECIVRLYGDSDTVTLDIQLAEGTEGDYIIAPQSTIINGLLKNKALFRVTESTDGHFLITADMTDFDELDMFGLNMENISSLAWYLAAINTETKEMHSFLLASAFPDDYTWEGLKVSDGFTASSGIVMWVQRSGSYTYLCTFNGSEKKIEADLIVTAVKGDMISDSFRLDLSSGEFNYQQIGFTVEGVTVKADGNILLAE